MSDPERTTSAVPPGAPSFRRLLTPGLAWLLFGLSASLIAVFALGWVDPDAPDWAKGAGTALANGAVWLGCLAVTGAGLGAVIQGLLQMAAADRREQSTPTEASMPPPSTSERVAARATLAVGGLLGGAAILLGAAYGSVRPAMSPIVIAVSIGLMAVGLASALSVFFALGRRSESGAAPQKWRQNASAGLSRPVPHLHLAWLLLLMAVAVGLQLTLVRWIVEDAAISFAYARHFADGEGLVTYPGGERVEGFSNPLWTFLLAGFYRIGVDGFISNKIMGIVFGALTVPLTWAIAREARPHRADAVPIVAAAVLAVSAQFAIWSAGGLENSLLNILLALAVWRSLVEARRGGLPLSALAWVGVAMTRPEGILFAAIGGFWSMVFRASANGDALVDAMSSPRRLPREIWRALSPTLGWLFLFFVPFGIYQAWRYDYFAWELPNTYYAKKGNPSKSFEPFEWTRKGWKYVRGWAHSLGQGYLIPVYLVGLLGSRGLRGALVTAGLVAVGIFLLIPGPDWFVGATGLRPILPSWWGDARIWALAGVSGVAIVAAVGRPGWRALVLCASVVVAAIFFAIYAGGDWMGGYRWFATWAVPGAILIAVGLGELSDRVSAIDRLSPWVGVAVGAVAVVLAAVFGTLLQLPPVARIPQLGMHVRPISGWILLGGAALVIIGILAGFLAQRWRARAVRWGPLAWTVTLVGLSFVAVPSLSHLDRFWGKPTTSPWKVKKRVNYMNWVQSHLHMDERPITMDVDMGATMYWSDDRIVDIAGLVDVPMAHRWFDKPFIGEYIFQEQRPHFAHVHGGWASTSGLKRFAEWDEQYLEIPPYHTSKKSQHVGNHVRKDLIAQEVWHGPAGRSAGYTKGLVLEGWDIPAAESAPGRHLYVEIGWSIRQDHRKGEEFRALLFLSTGDTVVQTWDLPPGYDWYPPKEWLVDEVVVGRHSLPVPDDLPLGTYDVGIVVYDDPAGTVSPVLTRPEGSLEAGVAAVMTDGEVRWADQVAIRSVDEVDAHAMGDLTNALSTAAGGDCVEAEDLWRLARRRTTRTLFDELHEGPTAKALASCWAAVASRAQGREPAVEALTAARAWNHRSPDVVAAAKPWAETWMTAGLQARDAGDWALAYGYFRDVLAVQPTRSWARRYAVEARDCKLRIRLEEHDCALPIGESGLAKPPPSPGFNPLRRGNRPLPVLRAPATESDDEGGASP